MDLKNMSPESAAPSFALLSVSEKTDLLPLARALHAHGVILLSTGGTLKHLHDAGVPVRAISDHTGFPEMLGGRLKTLHPHVHGGILGRRGVDDAVLLAHEIPYIDWVVVNLYPFAQTVAQEGCRFEDAVEQIDIGGPTLLRAAAKNHAHVNVLSHPDQYPDVLDALAQGRSLDLTERKRLAQAAFAHTAAYDAHIAHYFNQDGPVWEQETPSLPLQQHQRLKYGENPHQGASFFRVSHQSVPWTQHAGPIVSHNNLLDTDAAIRCAMDFEAPTCVVVKHATPCGVASATTLLQAYQHAYQADPLSAFGGVIAFNRTVDADVLAVIAQQQFAEVVVAPAFSGDVASVARLKPRMRLLSWPHSTTPAFVIRSAMGGFLVQQPDRPFSGTFTLACGTWPDEATCNDARFAFQVVQHVRSNAIVVAREGRTLGIGGGQPSRVFAARIAGDKAHEAGHSLEGSVMASDAFIPFEDTLDVAHRWGVRVVVQPGGSQRDPQICAHAQHLGITLLFTGERHFSH